MPNFQLHVGNCLTIADVIEENSVDTVITDPPYGLSFDNQDWDKEVPGASYWASILRVAKPGAFMFAFGGPYKFHRLAVAIEDAGWELRDCMAWMYGNGFPKGADIGYKIEKKYGHSHGFDGWNSTLKPAWEPIIVAMKPIPTTFADNAVTYGVAGLHVDAHKIGDERVVTNRTSSKPGTATTILSNVSGVLRRPVRYGRYPTNVILDEESAQEMDELNPKARPSRFFYAHKSLPSERRSSVKHPTPKPFSILRYLCSLSNTPTGGVVLDPFMGSGTTGVAALQTGRSFIGMDISEEYVQGAYDNIIAHVGEQSE